jgi:hypothetical protein
LADESQTNGGGESGFISVAAAAKSFNIEELLNSKLANKQPGLILLPNNSSGVAEASLANWPNPPLTSSTETTSLASVIQPMHNLNIESGNATSSSSANAELKSLLVQMTQTLKRQHDEIESLKRAQLTSQNQLKSHIDTSLKQFLHAQQKLNNGQSSSLNSSQVNNGGGVDLFANEDLQTKLVLSMQQTLTGTLMPKMEKTIKEEIHKTVHSQYVQRLLDPLREQISRDIAEKMKSVESVLKDGVSKLFKSKTTLDNISQSVTGSMQNVIVNSYRDTFTKMVVPTFEKQCQVMFQQV